MTDLYDGIIEGAVLRVRPKLMTVSTTIIALLPVMAGNVFESGSQVMQRIAAPMVGGLLSAIPIEGPLWAWIAEAGG